jgi:hypothetical protein
MSSNPPPMTEAMREQAFRDTLPQHASPSLPMPAAVISAEQLKAARRVLEAHAGKLASASAGAQAGAVSP